MNGPTNIVEMWRRAEAIREAAVAKARRERQAAQRIGRFDILDLEDPPRNPDGTRAPNDPTIK